MNIFTTIKGWVDRRLHIEQADTEVKRLKDDAMSKIEETNQSLRKATNLQNTIMKKTTTYYVGKAAGVIK